MGLKLNSFKLKNNNKNKNKPSGRGNIPPTRPKTSASLADQIAQVQLKSRSARDNTEKQSNPVSNDGMGGLRDALAKMRDNFESDDDEEDEDWSD